jgi:uncharacterized protein YndB with AHSA1/START domain
MTTDRVERDVLIEAPIDLVWEVVTEPEHLTRWFCDEVRIDLQPGGEGSLTFEAKATGRPTTVTLQIEAVDRPRFFSYRWAFPRGEEARAGNSMLVEFSLSEEGAVTRLRVVESGITLTPWPEAEKAKYAQDHARGWATHLANVVPYVEGVRARATS